MRGAGCAQKHRPEGAQVQAKPCRPSDKPWGRTASNPEEEYEHLLIFPRRGDVFSLVPSEETALSNWLHGGWRGPLDHTSGHVFYERPPLSHAYAFLQPQQLVACKPGRQKLCSCSSFPQRASFRLGLVSGSEHEHAHTVGALNYIFSTAPPPRQTRANHGQGVCAIGLHDRPRHCRGPDPGPQGARRPPFPPETHGGPGPARPAAARSLPATAIALSAPCLIPTKKQCLFLLNQRLKATMHMMLGSPSAASFGDTAQESDTGPVGPLTLTGHACCFRHSARTAGSSPHQGNTEK